MINLIGINGYIGSGKDTVGNIIQYLITHPNSLDKTDSVNRSYNSFKMDVGMGFKPEWEIKKFAGKLKQIASLMTGISIEKFEDQEFKRTFLGEEWNYKQALPRISLDQQEKYWEERQMTVREFLQKLGTEAIRNGLHTNALINATFADYKLKELSRYADDDAEPRYPKWILTDCRFPNEAQAIKDRGGIVIRINRLFNDKDYTSPQHLHPSETALDNWNFDWEIDNDDTIDILIRKVKEMLLHFDILSKEVINN